MPRRGSVGDDALHAHDFEVAALEQLQRVDLGIVPSRVGYPAQVPVAAVVGHDHAVLLERPKNNLHSRRVGRKVERRLQADPHAHRGAKRIDVAAGPVSRRRYVGALGPGHREPERMGDGARRDFVEAHQTFVVTPETEAGWRGNDPQRTFKEFGTHVLDLCKTFFGERPAGMTSRMPRPFADGGPDYLNLIQLDFTGDRVAQITLDRLTKGRHNYLDMRLVGEKGTIETSVGGSAAVTMGLRPQGKKPFVDLGVHMGGVARLYHGDRYTTLAKAPLDLFPDATARLFRAFAEAIEADRDPPNSIDDARDTLDLIYRGYAEAGARRR